MLGKSEGDKGKNEELRGCFNQLWRRQMNSEKLVSFED